MNLALQKAKLPLEQVKWEILEIPRTKEHIWRRSTRTLLMCTRTQTQYLVGVAIADNKFQIQNQVYHRALTQGHRIE